MVGHDAGRNGLVGSRGRKSKRLGLFADVVLNAKDTGDVASLALFERPRHARRIETPLRATVGIHDRVEAGKRPARGPMGVVEEIGFLALRPETFEGRPQVDRLDVVSL